MNWFIVLWDTLYSANFPVPVTDVIMIESRGLAMRYHQQKIVFFLSSMRSYADSLTCRVHYTKLCDDYFDALKNICTINSISVLHLYEIEDKFFSDAFDVFCKKNSIQCITYSKPWFLTTRIEFDSRKKTQKRFLMNNFYIWQRKRLWILVTNNEPTWWQRSYDDQNRKKLPSKYIAPEISFPSHTQHTCDVVQLVQSEFGDHVWVASDAWLPTTRTDALSWLDQFFKKRFALFWPYEDAFEAWEVFLHHGVLSALLNIWLLVPQEIISQALTYDVSISTLEWFVRQIIWRREFVRGMYHDRERWQNYRNTTWSLTQARYDGTTGIVPLDDAIKKAIRRWYSNHIERLMVIWNCMLLAGINPKQVHQWYMEMYIDSADRVMDPNVYGMSQMSDGPIFATKPYICWSNYLLKMSHYKPGDRCDVMDGLYWRFIDKHREFFVSNPRMSMMIAMLDRMDTTKKDRLIWLANTRIATTVA